MPYSIQTPGSYTITMRTNTTFSLDITFSDANGVVDLTSYTAELSIKDVAEKLYLMMSTGSGNILLGSGSPNIMLNLSTTDIATLPVESLWYDLIILDNLGNSYCILAGALNVIQGITP